MLEPAQLTLFVFVSIDAPSDCKASGVWMAAAAVQGSNTKLSVLRVELKEYTQGLCSGDMLKNWAHGLYWGIFAFEEAFEGG